MTTQLTPLLAAHDVSKYFPIGRSGVLRKGEVYIQAVREISIHIDAGETLGLVGESGCGKSTLARLLGLLYTPEDGSITLNGKEVTHLPRKQQAEFRRQVQMVFQDPFSSLNPRLPISSILAEPLRVHGVGNRRQRQAQCAALLDDVGLSRDLLDRYAHEFSGGQRQRIAIARALALQPKLIIADEAVSALDVSVQSQILNLLVELKQRLGLAYLFITHDLAVVDHIADRIAVMYLGRIVEAAPREEFFRAPAHPYTQALIDSVPAIQIEGKRRSGLVIGDVPSALAPPSGCAYHPRCPRAEPICREQRPQLTKLIGRPHNHLAACHFPMAGSPMAGGLVADQSATGRQ